MIEKRIINLLFALLVMSMLVACTQEKAQEPLTEEQQLEEAQRQAFAAEDEADNWEEYCKEKYTDNVRRLSNAENDLMQHKLDLADAQEINDDKQITVIEARITADEEDIAEAQQWVEDTKVECADVALEE